MFSTFYHGTIRKYVVVFGTLFNNIYINRVNSTGEQVQSMKVPLSYGPKDKFLARLENDPTFNRPAMVLPRMAFEISSMSYASERKLNTVNRNMKAVADTNKVLYNYMQVPYDIGFTLYIMVKNADDGTRIIEQILPYFTPEWTISAKLLADFENTTDIPLLIQNVNIEDTYSTDFTQRRALIWTINFTMKAYLYGPVTQAKQIKIATVNSYAPMTANLALQRVVTQPGLDANGNPTTLLANTVSYTSIDETDNFDYIVTTTDFPSG